MKVRDIKILISTPAPHMLHQLWMQIILSNVINSTHPLQRAKFLQKIREKYTNHAIRIYKAAAGFLRCRALLSILQCQPHGED